MISSRKVSYLSAVPRSQGNILVQSDGKGSDEKTLKKGIPPNIRVASPKYNQFAKEYLDDEGNVRADIRSRLLNRPGIKGVRPVFDFDARKWSLEIITDDPAAVCRDPVITELPCHIVRTGVFM